MTFPEIFIFVAEIIGTIAFSVAGTMVAIRRELDIFGAVVVGTVTAVGGGCTRDIILGILPPSMFKNAVYTAVAAAVAVAVFVIEYIVTLKRIPQSKTYESIINVFDALGLAIFVVVGINTAESCGYGDNSFLSIFVGVITGIGGGVLRDVLVGTVPMILRKQVYALPAIFGGIMYYVMNMKQINEVFTVIVTVALIMIVRILAAYFRWDLPKIKRNDV